MAVTIHLVRHGEVDNPDQVIYGRLPGFRLSERGKRQAEAAAAYLEGRPIEAIWASPLERAQDTALVIAARHDLDVVTDDRLIESATNLEGTGRNLVAFLRSPRVWWRIRDPLRPSWGESYSDIRARMLDAAREALEGATGEVVFVSHQTPVQSLRKALAGRAGPPWFRERCTTASVSTITLEGEEVVATAYFEPEAP